MFLGLGLARLQQLLHESLVVQRRLQVGLAFQGLFVGVQGSFQFTAAGQGIASIVVGGGGIALGKGFGGAGIVARLVQGHAAPLRVLELARSACRAVLLQQALALLVGAQPQVVELEGLAGLGQGQQQRQAE